jgi:hypothetical protein
MRRKRNLEAVSSEEDICVVELTGEGARRAQGVMDHHLWRGK